MGLSAQIVKLNTIKNGFIFKQNIKLLYLSHLGGIQWELSATPRSDHHDSPTTDVRSLPTPTPNTIPPVHTPAVQILHMRTITWISADGNPGRPALVQCQDNQRADQKDGTKHKSGEPPAIHHQKHAGPPRSTLQSDWHLPLAGLGLRGLNVKRAFKLVCFSDLGINRPRSDYRTM